MKRHSQRAKALARKRRRQQANCSRYLPPKAGKPLTKAHRRRLKKTRPAQGSRSKVRRHERGASSAVAPVTRASVPGDWQQLPAASPALSNGKQSHENVLPQEVLNPSANTAAALAISELRVDGKPLDAITLRALRDAGITTAGVLSDRAGFSILRLKGMGPTRVAKLEKALTSLGLPSRLHL